MHASYLLSYLSAFRKTESTLTGNRLVLDIEPKRHGGITAMLDIAMIGGLPYTALWDADFAHPTLAELLNTLFATLDDALSKQTS